MAQQHHERRTDADQGPTTPRPGRGRAGPHGRGLGRGRSQRRASEPGPGHRREPDAADLDHRLLHRRLRRAAALRGGARRPLRAQAAARHRPAHLRRRGRGRALRHRPRPAHRRARAHGRRRRRDHAHHAVGHHHLLPRGRSGHRRSACGSGIAGGGAILGLFATGLLLEWFSWSSFFGLNVALARRRARRYPRSRARAPSTRTRPALDIVGALLSLVGHQRPSCSASSRVPSVAGPIRSRRCARPGHRRAASPSCSGSCAWSTPHARSTPVPATGASAPAR